MRHLLDFHYFHGKARTRDSRRLMTFFRSWDIEELEELRICLIVRPLTGCWQIRNLHTKRFVVEPERAVHVFDKGRERSGAEDRYLAGF